jgi:hypothetical protein
VCNLRKAPLLLATHKSVAGGATDAPRVGPRGVWRKTLRPTAYSPLLELDRVVGRRDVAPVFRRRRASRHDAERPCSARISCISGPSRRSRPVGTESETRLPRQAGLSARAGSRPLPDLRGRGQLSLHSSPEGYRAGRDGDERTVGLDVQGCGDEQVGRAAGSAGPAWRSRASGTASRTIAVFR